MHSWNQVKQVSFSHRIIRIFQLTGISLSMFVFSNMPGHVLTLTYQDASFAGQDTLDLEGVF